ncbi:uncharacterized protein LOC109860036 isoform X2 [Pseudomyrmex gracilis]|uniref:uncharacterized protein LOC109860036 isoform X2 n=1 Tax=Pseudomyrmex gracilis TaxID=219809 RepID=UPI000995550C|nr:uncharacterized protein LOC109860036 isoform X2 [Pseudomyrmex gracilis]
MAYVNVAEWKTDQVCEWLKGLDNSIHPYVHSFMNHNVNGQRLLNLQPEDLDRLGILKIGHQEIIFEAVEYLRNLHYELDRENLQLLALRLSCQAHSLYNELSHQTDSNSVTTQSLSNVASVMMTVKPLVRWLDRPPFTGKLLYNDKKAELMKLSLEMATCAQRDRFAEKPIEEIRAICSQLAILADYIIRDIVDSMILQPSSLDLATLKKKSDDLGFYILPSFHGTHQIAEIKFGSVAHQCGKMEEGDEIVQVNYQTVVGWERKNVLELFHESPAEILLTLKRRPRHTKVYGQIYIKPYRLPSNKMFYTTRWQHNLPSPRPELLTIPDFTMPLPRHIPKNPCPEPTILDTENITTDSSGSDSEAEQPFPICLYSTKPRNLIQRRATITGASPTTKHGINIEQFWKELKQEHITTFQLREKAASCAHGLDNVNIRPQTCLGIESTKRKKKTDEHMNEKKMQFEEKLSDSEIIYSNSTRKTVSNTKENISFIQNCADIANKDDNKENLQALTDNINDSNNSSDIIVPLDECNTFISGTHSINTNISEDKINEILHVKESIELDKRYNTSVRDLLSTEDLENEKLALLKNPFNNFASIHSLNNVSSLTKNACTSTEDVDCRKLEDINKERKKVFFKRCNGNVAQKIDNIEKQIVHKNMEETCVSKVLKKIDSRKNIVHTMMTDVNLKNSIKNKNQSDVESSILAVNEERYIVKKLHTRCENVLNKDSQTVCSTQLACECQHENVDFSNSEISNTEACNTSSSGGYSNDNNSNNNSNNSSRCSSIEKDKTLQIFGKKVQIIDCGSRDINLEKKSSIETKILSSNMANFIEDDLPLNIVHNISKIHINSKLHTANAKSADTGTLQHATTSCRYRELSKIESVRKLDNNSYITPPEPPPRIYNAKQTVLDLNNASKNSEDLEKPQVPERTNSRQECKKVDLFANHTRSNSNCQDKKDFSEARMLNYVENSIGLINESRTTSSHSQKFMQSDVSLYTENKQSKEEKYSFEPFAEKFVYSSQTDCSKSDYFSRNGECLDSIIYSKQTTSLDIKPKLSEKEKSFEKSVVNRAIMVARSIGLHGSLSKSNSSPRSNRKKNILLAKRRNVSVKEVGTGDLDGWLIYRSKGAGGAWLKAWFVLKCSSLYRFKTQDSMKADCLIVLTGFTVSLAVEVKSRKYAFKIYHTGTVFYFAADTEDCLTVWLDAINKGTLGADVHSIGLFSETDESDNENHKNKTKYVPESKPNLEKSFGSLKKTAGKDIGTYKEHEITGASLDRKYLKFLSARNQNIPVPTAQFRSYRKVLPTSTPNKKEDFNSNSPDLQVTIAGSTFYGLSVSQSTTDISSSSNNQDIDGYYRRTLDRSVGNCNRGPENYITIEEFILSQQDENQRQSTITTSTPSSHMLFTDFSDHAHVQHRNLNDDTMYNEQIKHLRDTFSRSDIYKSDELLCNSIYSRDINACMHTHQISESDNFVTVPFESKENSVSDKFYKCKMIKRHSEDNKKKISDSSNCQMRKAQEFANTQHKKYDKSIYPRYAINHNQQDSPSHNSNILDYKHNMHISLDHDSCQISNYRPSRDFTLEDFKPVAKQLTEPEGYSGSSNNFVNQVLSETQHTKNNNISINRKGSFNFTYRYDFNSSDKHSDKKNSNYDGTNRLKNVAQYQPPPIPTSPFEQEGMRAAFEMHLDRGDQVQKSSRLKSSFGTKQKPTILNLSKNTSKTVLESPNLHRAQSRDKTCFNQSQHQLSTRSGSRSSGESVSGISQSRSFTHSQSLSQSFSSVSSVSEWNSDTSPLNISKV